MKLSENKIQSESVKWLWNTYPKTRRLFFSIPLGGLRTPTEASQLQATGAVKGTPDTLLAISGWHGGNWCSAMFIEFKTDSGKLSPEQVKSHEALKAAGNGVIVVRSLDEFQKFIHQYLEGSEYLS
jgi:hypothetical protein